MEKDEKNVIEPVVDTTDNNDVVVEPTQDENPNPVVDNNTETESAPVVEPEPVLDAPLADIAPPMQDIPVDTPVEEPTLATTDEVIPAPVEEPEVPVVDPVIPEDPAALAPAEPVATDGCDGCLGCVGDSCDPGTCVTVANLFGTIQECVTIIWRFHLKTRKHHVHVDLADFYDKALDIVDDIIERYQGINGIVEDTFTNCVVGDGKDEISYLQELKSFVEKNKYVLGENSEIHSAIDDFLGLIDTTLYKLTSFCEHAVKSFDEFVYEDFNESCCHSPENDLEGEEEEEEE